VADAGRPQRFVALVGDAQQAVQVVPLDDGRFQVTVDDRTHVVDARQTGAATWSLLIGHATAEVNVVAQGDAYAVEVGGRTHRLRLLNERQMRARRQAGDGEKELRASMPGKVVAVLVRQGDTVERGQGLLVIEAMKMENEILAPRGGTVQVLKVQPGQAVESGELLAVIE
jgi:biotin carboxyl carrier protein